MRSWRKTRGARFAALFAALALVLAACADDEPAEEAADDADEAPDDEPDDDPADDEADDEGDEGDDWPETLRFGVTPADDTAGQEERFGAMVRALEEDLGVEVEFLTATSYAGLIEGLISGDLDLAVMSPFAYVIATGQDAAIDARAAYIRSPGAEPTYQSFGLARADSGVTELSQYEGQRVCFVDPGSASGFLVPSAGLLDLGIDPEADVAEAIFAGGHDNSVLAIQDGTCDAGFAVDSMLPRMEDTGEVEQGEIDIIWESPPIAGVVMAVQQELPQSLQDAIAESFLENNGTVLYERGLCHDDWVEEDGPDDEPMCVAFGLGIWGFAEVNDTLYDGLREVCEITEAPACVDPEA